MLCLDIKHLILSFTVDYIFLVKLPAVKGEIKISDNNIIKAYSIACKIEENNVCNSKACYHSEKKKIH